MDTEISCSKVREKTGEPIVMVTFSVMESPNRSGDPAKPNAPLVTFTGTSVTPKQLD